MTDIIRPGREKKGVYVSKKGLKEVKNKQKARVNQQPVPNRKR
jgi:hypothetical protein